MNEHLIGSGALLTAGANTLAMPASVHARTDPATALAVRAALVDFEGSASGELSRVVILAAGWTAQRFDAEIVRPLAAREALPLGDVLKTLGRATRVDEMHIFARWLPGEGLIATLRAANINVVAHPLETITQAVLICGQRYTQWHAPRYAA